MCMKMKSMLLIVITFSQLKTLLIGESSCKHCVHCENVLIHSPAESPSHHLSCLTVSCWQKKETCLCGSIQHNSAVCARLGVTLIPPEKWVRETVSVMCRWLTLPCSPCDIACLTHRWAGSLFFSTAACKLSRAPLACGLLHSTASKSLCLSVYVSMQERWCQGCLPDTLREGLGLCGPQWLCFMPQLFPYVVMWDTQMQNRGLTWWYSLKDELHHWNILQEFQRCSPLSVWIREKVHSLLLFISHKITSWTNDIDDHNMRVLRSLIDQ